MKTMFHYLSGLAFIGILFVACSKDDNSHIEHVNTEIYDMMKEVYLWNDYMSYKLDPGSYKTPVAFMEALRYEVYDKWSTVITKEEYNQYFEEGTMVGHGFSMGLDESENVRIVFIYRNNQAYNKGVRRGWIVSKINGAAVTPSNVFDLLGDSKAGITNNITFIDGNGVSKDISLTKEEISLTPVLHYAVLQKNEHKIGYMVFQDFIETAYDEIDEVFNTMTQAGITDMIVDLRYNGGGSVDVAEHIAGWLIGKNFAGQPFIRYQHNGLLASNGFDTVINVPANANGLSFNRLFFIGTQNSASASELLINGVDPFVETIMAGSATHGKPVGMYVIPIEEYMTLPVCFKYTNKNFVGDFYNGLAPDIAADDDITRDFGDPEEASLKAIINYIDGAGQLKSTGAEAFPGVLLNPEGPMGDYLKAY